MDPLTSLLLQARDGDPEALERFIRRTQHDVWAVCRSLGDSDNAEDLVQDTYARALRSLSAYNASGPAKHWLLTIARRTCADATRKRIRRRRYDSSAEVDDTPYLDADTTVVDELLDTLDPERREAFVLTQLAGCSYEDAAAILGCPVGTVRSRVSRARRQLLPLVQPEPGSGRANV